MGKIVVCVMFIDLKMSSKEWQIAEFQKSWNAV